MRTTTSASTRSTPLVTSRLATPPPPTHELRHDDTVFGWFDATAIGFRGFADEAETAHAAWVAYRTMARRFARTSGRRPPPVDTEPMSLARSGDVELILAGGQPIAALVRPGADSRSGPESFGFEVQHPVPADAATLRSTAYLVYRTLRRSGIRWSLWTPAPSRALASSASRADDRAPAAATSAGPVPRRGDDSAALPGARRADAPSVRATLLIILVMLTVVTLPSISVSGAVVLLGGAAALVALFALASLVRLVATDVREERDVRRRERQLPSERLRARRADPSRWSRTLRALSGEHPRQPIASRAVAPST